MTAIPECPADILGPYNVSRESLKRLEDYVEVLATWQRRINLIGPSTVSAIWTRHVLDAVQLLPLLPRDTKLIADLGSGAGIPGLVVAIAGHIEAHLYESIGKKVAFLRDAARKTGVSTHIHQVRLERLKDITEFPVVQCVMARALAPLPLLLDYAEPFLRRGAIGLFHKGQDVDQELTEATKYWKLSFEKHRSACDPRGVILEVKEATRV